MSIRAFSFGGGVQSTAALVLAATGVIDFPLFLFANVGDDSENPATLRYVAAIAKPYAATHDIALVEVAARETLLSRTLRNTRSVPIPVRMSGSGAIGTRQCTQRFKIAPIAAELKRRGATVATPATLGLGISVDEYQRMRSTAPVAFERLVYPLIELRLDRQDCLNVIARAGLPTPPKSSCYFCPFQTMRQWQQLRRDDPLSFDRACDLEDAKNRDRAAMGKDPVWLSAALRPLRDAVTENGQLDMFESGALQGGCDIAGYCHV